MKILFPLVLVGLAGWLVVLIAARLVRGDYWLAVLGVIALGWLCCVAWVGGDAE
jgi:hypothetical protein